MKVIEFNTTEKIQSASKKLEMAVGSTLGAGGRNVLFQTGNQFAITKDGVTVSKQVEFEDEAENAVAQIIKDAAARTAIEAGDGTTTSTVIANAIIQNVLENNAEVPMNVTRIRKGIEDAANDLINEISKNKKDINTREDIFNIAKISGNNDEAIGKMMLDVYDKVGRNGAVRLEETQSAKTHVDVVNGGQFESGYITQHFITNSTKRIAEYDNPVIFITDKKFENGIDELVPALEVMISKERPMVIICGGMEGEPLGTLAVNKTQRGMKILPIQAPYFGDERIEILEDISAMTGATLVSEAKGFNLSEITESMLGSADKVISDSGVTTIIGRHGKQEEIKSRIEHIKSMQEEDRSNDMKWRLEQRLASLTDGVGVIYVGGNSEAEMKDMYYRLEDALSATKAALNNGYVIGGGMSYYNAAEEIEKENKDYSDYSYSHGYKSMIKSAKSPLFRIMKNSGYTSSSKFPKEIGGKMGWDAVNVEVCDIEERGIIDPFKVIESSLKNASSVAAMLITTNVIITDERRKK